MESSNLNINSMNLPKNFEKNLIHISLKTSINHIFQDNVSKINFYDFINNKILFQFKTPEFFITSITKFKFINSSNPNNYLLISSHSKYKKIKNEIFLIENNNNNLKKVEISLSKCLEDEIQKIIILDNNDIVAIVNWKYVSYFINGESNCKRFFRNLNKGHYILGLIKLSQKRFCFLSSINSKENMLIIFNKDFNSKEKIIKIIKPLFNIKNNLIFNIKNNKIIIIGKFEFIILDINSLQIQTRYQTGLICNILPFNKNNNCNNNEKYTYLAFNYF